MSVNTAEPYAVLRRGTALEALKNHLTQLTYVWGDPAVAMRLQKKVPERAAYLLDRLQSDDRAAARSAGEDVLRMLFSVSAPTSTWFGSPLGLLVFHALYRADEAKAVPGALTRADAAGLLGVTRQRVHAMIKAGQLQPHPDGGLTAASVEAILRARSTG